MVRDLDLMAFGAGWSRRFPIGIVRHASTVQSFMCIFF
jgi:hypothetical protein